MDTKVLEGFRTENYAKLSLDERVRCIGDLIRSITEENGLSSLNIVFGDGYSFDRNNNTLTLSKEDLENSSLDSNFVMLSGVIHEMRHKYQFDKGLDNDGLVYQMAFYNISPIELDAHQYTTQELIKLTDFFDDVEFDRYVYVLMNNDSYDVQTCRRGFILDGYSIEEQDRLAKEHAEYAKGYITTLPKQDKAMKNGEEIDVSKLGFMEQYMLLNDPEAIKYSISEDGKITILSLNFTMFVNGDKAYVPGVRSPGELSLATVLTSIDSYLERLKNNNIREVSSIVFPPILFVAEKEKQEALYSYLGLEDGKLSVEKMKELIEDPKTKEFLLKSESEVGYKDDRYLKEMLGLDYAEKYSKEQQEFLISTIPYCEDYLAHRIFNEDCLDNPKSYFAPSEFKPEYSVVKMKLILAAQKSGLNTMDYGKLTEEHIKELILAQLEGVNRKGLYELVQSTPEEAMTVRKKVVGKNNKYKSFNITEECEIEVVPEKQQSLDDE